MADYQFHPVVARWFEQKYGSPTEPQQRGWPAIQGGQHTLIAAPTGSGKTLAAFFAALDQLFREGLAGSLPDETRVVYVSPLKALSNDIHKNLEEPLAGIRAALLETEGRTVDVRAEVRTGDTSQAKRQAIIRKPPHILVTTPESLYLLLTSVSGRKILSTVRTLIVDEIHAVVGNRRGSHLALSMERLAALTGAPLQRIGLSATQRPIELVADFLTGSGSHSKMTSDPKSGNRAIIDCGSRRQLNLAIEIPGAPLEAVMSHEVWGEVYNRLASMIESHRTTLVFVNTRRLAERVTAQLSERLGQDKVTSHHGSLSAKLRLDAENRLKQGQLKALVATASLELGIDIGSVDLVCQLGTTRSISTLLQRVGRAEHKRGGLPKGRIFPLSRDELVECVSLLRSLERGELDRLEIPDKPLDVLAQQLVACAGSEDWEEARLFDLVRSAWPYRNLTRPEFDAVLKMLAEGFSTKRGRRGALIHHDAINHRVRGRRGARLVALTSGGAIPDTGDYRVVVEPSETFVGTVNEDFAIESLAGDIFQLGNASWRILRVNSSTVRVEDAHGQPPSIPFWLGEAPGRTRELSKSVSEFRSEVECQLAQNSAAGSFPAGVPEPAISQLNDYFTAGYRSLGCLPSQTKLVIERFFDESGGMQLVIHSPFGIRVNRGWGLALRKRFCRSFNFELQAAATDDAIVLSLGTQHSFPLEEVFSYLNSKTVRELLIQALLDAPMFAIRWRWNASRALALPRQRGGRKIPAPLQRMESENLLAAVFPDQLACLENIVGDREVPEHPLVHQTIEDCLTEAMDIDGLIHVLQLIERGEIECIARDLPEPSPLAHEILNARPYAFLDDAPLEERRTRAVLTRRAGDSSRDDGLGILDAEAIEKVCAEAWPRAVNPDELHDALLMTGAMTEPELARTASERQSEVFLSALRAEHRANRLALNGDAQAPVTNLWFAAERAPLLRAVYPTAGFDSSVGRSVPESEAEDALRELVRGRMEVVGPTTASALAGVFHLSPGSINTALFALEREGFVLRGKFHPNATELEWCDRRLLARIHRLTINRLRAEIQPVSIAQYQRFLLAWQRVGPEHRVEGPEGLRAILEMLDGYQIPAAGWEPEILSLRVKDYHPQWLDHLCFTGRVGWGRLTPPQNQNGRPLAPVRSSPISLFTRENLPLWLELSPPSASTEFSPDTATVFERLAQGGALFFGELVKQTGLLPSRVEQALAELAAQGWATSDSFEGLRALLIPQEKRLPFAGNGSRLVAAESPSRSRHKAVTSVEFAGRWHLLRHEAAATSALGARTAMGSSTPSSIENPAFSAQESATREQAIETLARRLLHRYGIVFRRLLERESFNISWYELGRTCRRLEAWGEIRGGHFVSGVSGEQFALPEAIALMRSIRKTETSGELVAISAADPLNLAGILTSGPRITAITSNRILLRDGVAIAALEAGEIVPLTAKPLDSASEAALRVGRLQAPLRPYYS